MPWKIQIFLWRFGKDRCLAYPSQSGEKGCWVENANIHLRSALGKTDLGLIKISSVGLRSARLGIKSIPTDYGCEGSVGYTDHFRVFAVIVSALWNRRNMKLLRGVELAMLKLMMRRRHQEASTKEMWPIKVSN